MVIYTVEDQHPSSWPILVSIYVNLFKIQALISQPLQKESKVNIYFIQESLAAVTLIMISWNWKTHSMQ